MKRFVFFALLAVAVMTAVSRNPKYYLYFDKVFISGSGEENSKPGTGCIIVYDNLDVVFEGSASGMGSFKVDFNVKYASDIFDGTYMSMSSAHDDENNQRIMFDSKGAYAYYWDTRGNSDISYSLKSTDEERNSATASAILESFNNRTGLFVNFKSVKDIELPLKVDGYTSDFNVNIPSGVYEKSYSVRTKSGKMVNETRFKDFEVSSDSYWAKIDFKTDAAFSLKAEANTTGYTRKANITVESGGVKTIMTVTQPSEVARIKQVWVDHNKFSGFVKGMKIHVKFETYNMRGVSGACSAYFFFDDGRRLMDYNKNYYTFDGQVCCYDTFIPPYENTTYNDFELFMPYAELHLGGPSNCMFIVELKINGQAVQSEPVYFQFY